MFEIIRNLSGKEHGSLDAFGQSIFHEWSEQTLEFQFKLSNAFMNDVSLDNVSISGLKFWSSLRFFL